MTKVIRCCRVFLRICTNAFICRSRPLSTKMLWQTIGNQEDGGQETKRLDKGLERHMKALVHILKNTRQHLMTGVSHMIPFVVSGGILLAVSVMLYGKGAVPDAATDPNLKKLFDIGVGGAARSAME